MRVPILDSLFVLCVLRENARRNFESPDTGGGDEGGTSDRLLSSRWAPGGERAAPGIKRRRFTSPVA